MCYTQNPTMTDNTTNNSESETVEQFPNIGEDEVLHLATGEVQSISEFKKEAEEYRKKRQEEKQSSDEPTS